MTVHVEPTGMGSAPFHSDGDALTVLMTRNPADLPAAPGPEQMVALIEGAARLVCPGESHALQAGEGILIPAGLACDWQVTAPALFYRVARK